MARDDFYASPIGAAYSAYMERPWLSRRLSRIFWGGPTTPYYESMKAIGEAPPGATIVDCPCGAGPAFRAAVPGRNGRYIAADLSPAMLERAKRRAAQRGLTDVEFVRAPAEDLPLATGSADLFLTYWGLHCFPDPAAALAEAGRVLSPGGRLVGSTFLKGDETLRQRFFIRPHVGDFGPIGTEAEVRDWLADAGFALRSASRSGPFLFFDAEVPAV